MEENNSNDDNSIDINNENYNLKQLNESNDLKEEEENDNENEEQGKKMLPDNYNLKFTLICQLFEAISKRKPKEKYKLLTNFINKFFKNFSLQKISLFQFFRLIFPKLDRLRATYGFQETFLGKFYSDILSLPEQERNMLKHWKNPNFIPSGYPVGDFVNLISLILQKRTTNKSSITINQLNLYLNDISSTKNKNEKIITLTKIIKECTSQEQKWIISIILKDLKIGLSYDGFFKTYDKRTIDIYNSTSSLIEVCNYLSNPKDEKYLKTFYRIFSPIKPMLVARMTLDKIFSTFQGINVIIETKFDGERIQCHKNDNEVKFYSRNGVDYTYLYGPKLSYLIKTSVNAKTAILDGEIVVYDKKNKKFAPFGENKTIALAENEDEKCLIYEIFDIIFITSPNDESYPLDQVILSDRKKLLSKLITPVPKKIEIVYGKETNNIDEIMDEFISAMNRGEEGIVIKKNDSIYKPDERCIDWVKMKCDYIDTIVDTLDLIIIGGYYGEGRRNNINNTIQNSYISNSINNNINSFYIPPSFSNNNSYSDSISTFLVGVIKEIDNSKPKKSLILPLVKVGTGYNMNDLNIIRDKLRSKWKKYDTRVPPSLFGQWIPAMSEKPDLYIEDPSESIILEVKAAEIVSSDNFPCKVTLRFPRVVKCRFDKKWDECLKYNELLEYYNISTNNIKNNNLVYQGEDNDLQHLHIIKNKKKKNILKSINDNIDEFDIDIDNGNKRRKNDKFSKMMDNFRDTDTTNIVIISYLFKGFQFFISNLDKVAKINLEKKRLLESEIVANGGDKTQNYLSSTTHVIAEEIDLKIKNILNNHDINIYNSKWVYDCIKYGKIIPVSPMYLTYINEDTKEIFKLNIDKYNDSYFENVDLDNLREIFNGMKNIDFEKENKKINNKINEEYKSRIDDIIN